MSKFIDLECHKRTTQVMGDARMCNISNDHNVCRFDVAFVFQNGADVSQLNLPELVNDDCYPSCSFTRKVKLLNSYNVVNPVWDVTVEQANGLIVTVTPNSFDLTSTNEVNLTINVDATANDVLGDWAEAKILFTNTRNCKE